MKANKIRVFVIIVIWFCCMLSFFSIVNAKEAIHDDISAEWKNLNLTEVTDNSQLSQFSDPIRSFDVTDPDAPKLLLGIGDNNIVIATENGLVLRAFQFNNASSVFYSVKWHGTNIELTLARSNYVWSFSQTGELIDAQKTDPAGMAGFRSLNRNVNLGTKEYILSHIYFESLGGNTLTVYESTDGSAHVIYNNNELGPFLIMIIIFLSALIIFGVAFFFTRNHQSD